MMFTEYKFDSQEVAQLVAQRAASLKANTGLGDLAGYGLRVIAERLQKEPARYLDYGPYWWSVKSLLRNAGYRAGAASDPLVEAEYTGATPEATLVMAEEFRAEYLATQIVGCHRFVLDQASAEWYVLFDPDQEGYLPSQAKKV